MSLWACMAALISCVDLGEKAERGKRMGWLSDYYDGYPATISLGFLGGRGGVTRFTVNEILNGNKSLERA